MTHEAPGPAPRPGTPGGGNSIGDARIAGAPGLGAPAAAVWALAATIACAGAGFAQIETGSKSPIDVTADQAEAVNARCMVVWRGSAEAIQDNTRIRADSITLYSKPKGAEPNDAGPGTDGQSACGAVERIVADGHVYYATPGQNAKGDHAVYTQADDQIVVTGDVVVVQGKDVARGDRLTIHVKDHQATLDSRVTGAGKAGRVRGVFYPDKTAPSTAPSDSPARP